MTGVALPQEAPAPARPARLADTRSLVGFLAYITLGTGFGFLLTKSEAVSWFRIQEMFRFQSFHMFGILGSAVLVAGLSVALIRRLELSALSGEPVSIPDKDMGSGYRYMIGGTIFGLGWALTGACPGPQFALIGSGASVFLVTVLAGLLGTWVYAWLRPRLPH
jgi:uncharacterized membrane protein YedE/YeeE